MIIDQEKLQDGKEEGLGKVLALLRRADAAIVVTKMPDQTVSSMFFTGTASKIEMLGLVEMARARLLDEIIHGD